MIITILTMLHALALFGLFLLGSHRTHLLWQFERRRSNLQKPPRTPIHNDILVQVPVYNEANVIMNCLEAVSTLQWPDGNLTIQILDDSSDQTSDLIRQFVHRFDGPHTIQHIQRTNRIGYKAGALAEGMNCSTAPLIAIFDADFQPHDTFLLELAPLLTDNIGMVQARWAHINRNDNRLTRASAVVLDGHFVIEHSGRHLQGCFFNFNGTAGIWRRTCIEAAGGWKWDTITEDLDLSYRAQLAGWDFIYTPLVSAQAEIPNEMSGLVAQQFRWAKGTTQTARKILPVLWKSQHPFKIKYEGTVHLLANLGYWMTLLLSIVLPFTQFLRWEFHSWWAVLDLGVFLSSFVALIVFHQRSQSFLNRWNPLSLNHWISVISALVVGVGLAPSQSYAVFSGLTNTNAVFERTPKSGSQKLIEYTTTPSREKTIVAQCTLLLGIYSTVGLLYSAYIGSWAAIPFQLIFSVGYLWVGLGALDLKRMVRT